MALRKSHAIAAAITLCGALSAQASMPSAQHKPANLLFWSGFEGPLKLLTPTDCYRKGCFQELIGTDSVTGFRWPFIVRGGENKFQLLVDGSPPTPETVGDYMFNQLRTVVGHRGQPTRALYSEVRQSGCCGVHPQGRGATQNVLHILPGAEPGDIYISKWLKLQPDLIEKLHRGDGWRTVFEWKEGVAKGGGFRTILNIIAYRGRAPAWQVKWDNEANGGLRKQEFWRRENGKVPVPVGEWFKLEVFWHRGHGDHGRIWYAVNGRVIDDHFGPNIGVRNDPVGRIMINQVYSGSAYPIYQWSDDVQIWGGFPTVEPRDPWYDPPYAPH